MDTSIFLAQVIGAFYTVVGLSVLIIRRNELESIVEKFIKNRTATFVAGEFVLLLGLLVVFSHNIWDGTWRTIITVIGWLAVLKGVMYLITPQNELKKMVRFFFKSKNFYSLWGIIIVAFGVYLLSKGL